MSIAEKKKVYETLTVKIIFNLHAYIQLVKKKKILIYSNTIYRTEMKFAPIIMDELLTTSKVML